MISYIEALSPCFSGGALETPRILDQDKLCPGLGLPEARERATIVVKSSFQAETLRPGLGRNVWHRALII